MPINTTQNMKRILFLVAAMQGMFAASAQQTVWALDKSHSSINFAIDHLVISETKGEFADYTMNVRSDKPDFTDAVFDLTIQVQSINTKDAGRDKDLQGDGFFDVAKYPVMTFKGRKFVKVKDNQYVVLGDLTLHGVTRPIKLMAKFGGIVKDPWGGTRAGVTVWGEIDRFDYGLKYNEILEAGGAAIGQMVRVNCSIELIKQ
jgi:polyisoprenoid-binding protein YceI